MESFENTRSLLLKHYHLYPLMEIRDLFKFIFQSAAGCEHLVHSENDAADHIREEWQSIGMDSISDVDELDGNYSRVHLSNIDRGLSAETLAKLFCLSAKPEPDYVTLIEHKIDTAIELVKEKKLPFQERELRSAAERWKAEGYPPVRHSEKYRELYRPAYRVISNRYVPYLPLFSSIDRLLKKGRAVVAIEGSSASGKTTLGNIICEVYDCSIIHMDDFFLRPEQRTRSRLDMVGGNIDHERFSAEVLPSLISGESIVYRPYDCTEGKLLFPVKADAKALMVVEGAYSMHPAFGKYFDLGVFLDIPPDCQRSRISKRNTPDLAKRFFNDWIPMETVYFSEMNIREKCDLIVTISE